MMRIGICILSAFLTFGWSTANADQLYTDTATDGIVGSDCHQVWVDDTGHLSRSVLVYTNSLDPTDPYKKTRIGNQCAVNGDATDLQTLLGLNTLGVGIQVSANNAVADDFTLAQDTTIEELVFYLYQTGATAVTVNRLDYAILSTNPLGQLQPVYTSVLNPAVTLTNVFRKTTPDADAAACTRRIQRVSIPFASPVTLPAGQYWLVWRSAGTSTSGPWQTTVVFPGLVSKPGANGMQSAAAAAFAPYYDTGGTPAPPPPGYPQDFPFEIYGTPADPSPQGACCRNTGTCFVTTAAACAYFNGTYQGDGTGCDPNPCPPPLGACCFPDGGCTYVTQADCTGSWLGAAVPCSPNNPCPQPGGNCANPLVIDFATLPYFESMTTCGMVNDYANTCLGTFDAGEDVLYTLLVPEPVSVTIVLTGVDNTDLSMGLAIDEVCPLGTATADCLLVATASGNASGLIVRRVDLAAGVYKMQIDNDNTPTCFEYNMWIFECNGACCLPNGDCLGGVASEADCLAAGGAYQGPDTDCTTFDASYTMATCTNAFEDIQATGTQLVQVDDSGYVVPIGFRFDFFGDGYTYIAIGSNGYLTFSNVMTDLSPDPFPTAATPNSVIAPFWRDLNPADANAPGQWIGYQTLGAPPNQRFIAEWFNVSQYATPANRNTFQAILYEGSNCIEFRYGTLMTPFAAANPKCGIENSTGTVGYDATALVQGGATCVSFCPAQTAVCAPVICLGDADCDGDVDFFDIDPFVAKIGCPAIDPVACDAGCTWQASDCDQDGDVDFFDIDPFVARIGAGCP